MDQIVRMELILSNRRKINDLKIKNVISDGIDLDYSGFILKTLMS